MIYDRRHILPLSPREKTVRLPHMNKLIVIEYQSLDGVTEDPDGAGGTPWGGWLFRHGPEVVAGDKFDLGATLDTGIMLLGRTTWELFSRLWPSRDDPFSRKMNAIPKLVATRTLTSVAAWQNSSVLTGDLPTVAAKLKQERDIVVTGSASIVAALRAEDLIDEYRLVVLPSVVGQGRRMFDGAAPTDLTLVAAERMGAGVRLTYQPIR